jgi:hypothetical protein
MSDDIKTIKELEIIFQKMTMQMLGFDITLESDFNFVRVGWNPEAPAFKSTDNISFVRCIEEDSPMNRFREINYTPIVSPEGLTASMQAKRVINCIWNFYGSTSFENASTVRDKLFYQDFHDSLAQNGLFLIPDIRSPLRVPEQVVPGKWWERTDFSALFNDKTIREDTIGYIKSADITIDDVVETRKVIVTP